MIPLIEHVAAFTGAPWLARRDLLAYLRIDRTTNGA